VDKVLAIIIAYLLGSIPFAYIAGRTVRNIDIRKVGDNNAGAANVVRHVGLISGIFVLIADTGKGALAVLVAQAMGGDWLAKLLAGIAAIVGHSWPIFSRFQGGRGEATAMGVFFLLIPKEIAITFGLAATTLSITRNTIWTGAALFAPLPFLCFFFSEPLYLTFYSAALPTIVAIRHFMTTRQLSLEAKKEAGRFWVGPKSAG